MPSNCGEHSPLPGTVPIEPWCLLDRLTSGPHIPGGPRGVESGRESEEMFALPSTNPSILHSSHVESGPRSCERDPDCLCLFDHLMILMGCKTCVDTGEFLWAAATQGI